ncbi:MAG: hypothetical protein IJA49_06035 [Oscillospiraceae bacterium]|nr:hypothetical protein [Oscillospiraceae bacterium]
MPIASPGEAGRIEKWSVGAIIDRPPKIFDFRIFQREIPDIFALRRTDFAKQNLRATNGRPYNNLF